MWCDVSECKTVTDSKYYIYLCVTNLFVVMLKFLKAARRSLTRNPLKEKLDEILITG